jgi:hypothetical protein
MKSAAADHPGAAVQDHAANLSLVSAKEDLPLVPRNRRPASGTSLGCTAGGTAAAADAADLRVVRHRTGRDFVVLALEVEGSSTNCSAKDSIRDSVNNRTDA